jgi:MFS superfamily sulfate permease-like transporter
MCPSSIWTLKQLPWCLILISRQAVKENWASGVSVALVNMPLSISLGVAAAATPTMGCATAIWAGGVAAFLGGESDMISSSKAMCK